MPLALLVINGCEPCAPRLPVYLASHGARVTSVANELDAFHEVRTRRYDCVVVDLGREPQDRGVLLTRALRAEHAVPIVLISSGADACGRADVLDAGADDCVAASCSEREILSRVLAIVRRSQRYR